MIRRYRPEDLDGLYDVCLRTGAAGEDATHLYAHPRLLGEVYAAPYGVLEPELAFVLEDEGGVAGYVLGALDTAAFEARLEREWWPALRARYPDPAALRAPGRLDEDVARLLHRRLRPPPAHVEAYPSHLHIDLLPRAQGRGDGRRLLSRLLDELASRGSPGVHLGVARANERAVGFYRHLGFHELAGDDAHLLLGLRLPPPFP